MGAVVRAPSCEGCRLPLLSAGEDRRAPPVVDIRRRDVVEPLVIPAMVVEVDERGHRGLEPPGTRVHEQVEPRLQRLVNPLELALGLRVMGRAVDVTDAEGTQVVLKRPGQVAEPWSVTRRARASSGACGKPVHSTACCTTSLIDAAVRSDLRSQARMKREKSSRTEMREYQRRLDAGERAELTTPSLTGPGARAGETALEGWQIGDRLKSSQLLFYSADANDQCPKISATCRDSGSGIRLAAHLAR